MDTLWLVMGAVLISALLTFSGALVYRMGYRRGGLFVLDQWKKSLDETGNEDGR